MQLHVFALFICIKNCDSSVLLVSLHVIIVSFTPCTSFAADMYAHTLPCRTLQTCSNGAQYCYGVIASSSFGTCCFCYPTSQQKFWMELVRGTCIPSWKMYPCAAVLLGEKSVWYSHCACFLELNQRRPTIKLTESSINFARIALKLQIASYILHAYACTMTLILLFLTPSHNQDMSWPRFLPKKVLHA